MITIPFCLWYRTHPSVYDRYFRAAFSSGKSVVYLTTMTKHLFAQIKADLTENTNLTILAWNPATAEEIIGFSRHLSEGDNKIGQLQAALEGWDKKALDHKNVNVFTYDSAPTMEGLIVEDDWALIELMPYAATPQSRPALIFRRSQSAERPAFEFFKGCFQTLLNSAVPRKIGDRSTWYPVGENPTPDQKRKTRLPRGKASLRK